MNLYEPFPRSFITQRFAQNLATFYKEHGMIGHTAIDYGVACGTPIPNCVDGAYVYSLMNKDNADLDKFRAVYTLFEDGEFVYEIGYGHLDQIFAKVGQTLKVGEIVGTSGNTGDVYMGDLKVTNELRKKIPCAGGHLHGPQVRKCRKVKKTSANKQYLSDSNGIIKWNGYYIEAVDYDNGLNACVDPFAFYNGKLATTGKSSGPAAIPAPLFTKDLMRGSTDPQVKTLQQYLVSKGFAIPAGATGYFGPQTEVALTAFQKAKGIKPAKGYFGKLTQAYIQANP